MQAHFSITDHGDGTATVYDHGIAIATIEMNPVDVSAGDGFARLSYSAQGRHIEANRDSHAYIGVSSRTGEDVIDDVDYQSVHDLAAQYHRARVEAWERECQVLDAGVEAFMRRGGGWFSVIDIANVLAHHPITTEHIAASLDRLISAGAVVRTENGGYSLV